MLLARFRMAETCAETCVVLDGKLIAEKVKSEVKQQVDSFIAKYSRAPCLHVVLVGEDPASLVYVKNKAKAAKKIGIEGATHRFSSEVRRADLEDLILHLNRDDEVDGILVQLPLPAGIPEQDVLGLIDPIKDVDGLHVINAGLLSAGRDALVACTPQGCMRLIAEASVKLEGLNAVVVGRSNSVGKPLAQLLLRHHATVTLAHSRTRDLGEVCGRADVLVAAVGSPMIIKGDWVKRGAVVIDVGINRLEDGSMVGDVEYEVARQRASVITPVPGGVGPMTIAYLLHNTVRAAIARKNRQVRPYA